MGVKLFKNMDEQSSVLRSKYQQSLSPDLKEKWSSVKTLAAEERRRKDKKATL
jgi:hypothetical protein